MAKLKSINADHFRIPLDVPASDSTHGVMTSFELVTVKVHRRRRLRRVSATPTPPATTAAPSIMFWPGRLPSVVAGADCRADRGGVAEGLVGAALWRPRRRGGARPLGARHGAVGSQGAAGGTCRSIACWAATMRGCRATPVASTSTSRSRICWAQTDANLAKGFRAIKTKVGREKAAGGCRAHPGDAQASGRRLPALWSTPT